MVRTRPYLGLAIIQTAKRSFERFDFAELYLKELLREPQSILYTELQNNQDLSRGHRYVISESNPVLHYLFNDVEVAEGLRAYKPVGDFIKFHLDELARDHEKDPYNQVMMGDYQEIGVWDSPVYAGARFFDIMVKEALFQGMQWHMWLYYMPRVVERICKNYRLCDPMADENDEFPIKYSFLLYEIFSYMRDWVRAIEDVPSNQPNVVLKSSSPELENGNIPKSSILALCESAYFVLMAEDIGERMKSTVVDMIFELYFELRSSGKYDGYASALLNTLIKGKDYRHDNDLYREAVALMFKKEEMEYHITHPAAHVMEVKTALHL